jgi:hypothetical protein
VDIVVISGDGFPVAAIEYQGGGHYQGNAAARDAVKREALRKAGVKYVEISETHSHDETAALVRAALAANVSVLPIERSRQPQDNAAASA